MMKRFILIYSIYSMLIMMQGCSNSDKPHESIVAYVGNDIITTADLTDVLKQIPRSNRFEYLTENGTKMLVEMLIDWKLMAREAQKIGLDKRSNIASRLNIQSSDPLNKEQILGNAYQQHCLEQMEPVNDAEIEKYYLSHKNDFAIPEKIKVERIFFSTQENARDALKLLKNGGLFEVYKQQNPSMKIKVDTIWLRVGQTNMELEHAVSGLEIGAISDILETKAGYCLLRIKSKQQARNPSLEEVEKGLRIRLQNEHERKLVETISRELRQGVTVTINDIVLKSYQCSECG